MQLRRCFLCSRRIHLPKLVPWVVFEAANIYQCLYLYSRAHDYHCVGEPVIPHCAPPTRCQVCIYVMVGMCGVNLAMYIYFVIQTYRGLARRPYAEARTANMLVRVEVRREGGKVAACRRLAGTRR